MVGRGGPRDLAAIRDGISAAAALAGAARPARATSPPRWRTRSRRCAAPIRRWRKELARRARRRTAAVQARRRLRARGLRRRARRVARAARRIPQGDRAACRRATPTTPACASLKIRHNNVLGYFVEVTAQHGDKLMSAPLNATFIHRQTLAGQVRFTTTELGELEAKIASAADRALGLELEIFERLAGAVIAASDAIKAAAEALALLDVACGACHAGGRAPLRAAGDRPHRSTSSSRAAAIPWSSRRSRDPFVANDCDLSPPKDEAAGRIWLLTGPNMAGKSTFLRQNALIVGAGADGQLRAGAARQDRRGRPAVLARRRRRRSGARALDLHGRDGRDRGDPQPGRRALARHPRRDRPRHRDLRRPVDRLGLDRAPARDQPLPRAVRHPFPRADRARRPSCRGCTTPPCG